MTAQSNNRNTDGETLSLKDGSTNSRVIAEYYDDWAETYNATLEEWNYRTPAEIAALLLPQLSDGDRILDVGCGTGLFGKALVARLNCRIDGIDISQASLDRAAKLEAYDRLEPHDLQVLPLPVPKGQYDAAACVGVLTYIEDEEALLRDFCRVVKPGGAIAFTQRDDRWTVRDFGGILDRLSHDGFWSVVSVSDPRPYLPGNDDFADDIHVIHTLCRVN